MSEHQLVGIHAREDIGGVHDHWHEVGCSCGWHRNYVSRYRAEVMFTRHVEREHEMERSAT
jgi:hypothetical protein